MLAPRACEAVARQQRERGDGRYGQDVARGGGLDVREGAGGGGGGGEEGEGGEGDGREVVGDALVGMG